jgi:c-di-GMP-binding flagellar brake protein YcgR
MFLFGRERKPAAAAAKKPQPAEASGAQKRGAFRSNVQLPVSYQIPNDRRPHRRIGIMQDISHGGMRLVTDRAFVAGTPIEMRFKLPSQFLSAFEKQVKINEVSPFGERTRKETRTVRPFDEMELSGSIVRSMPQGEKFALAIRFNGLSKQDSEEIARFNHFYQLWQVRKIKEREGRPVPAK